MVAEIRTRPHYFSEIVESHASVPWRDFLRAWGEVRALASLGRDDDGRYVMTSATS